MPKTLKSLKTPLRYPGGKSRAVVKLFQYLPDLTQVKEFREPFIGGGSVALEITKRYPNIEIWVNDLYEPLYNFWCELRDNGQDLEDAILSKKNHYPDRETARKLFNDSKEDINDEEKSNFEMNCLGIPSLSRSIEKLTNLMLAFEFVLSLIRSKLSPGTKYCSFD